MYQATVWGNMLKYNQKCFTCYLFEYSYGGHWIVSITKECMKTQFHKSLLIGTWPRAAYQHETGTYTADIDCIKHFFLPLLRFTLFRKRCIHIKARPNSLGLTVLSLCYRGTTSQWNFIISAWSSYSHPDLLLTCHRFFRSHQSWITARYIKAF